MPGISLLRPQYSNLGSVAARFAAGARSVAHEQDQTQLSELGGGRGLGAQDEAFTEASRQSDHSDDGQKRSGQEQRQAPGGSAAAGSEPNEAFRPQSFAAPGEPVQGASFLVAGPMPVVERLRAAERAYGYSRAVLHGNDDKPGSQLDAAS